MGGVGDVLGESRFVFGVGMLLRAAVALTYYTGKADTVAHVPERCYVGEGFDPVNPKTELWKVGERMLEVRHIQFARRETGGAADVAYFFQCNGAYESNSLRVRARL